MTFKLSAVAISCMLGLTACSSSGGSNGGGVSSLPQEQTAPAQTLNTPSTTANNTETNNTNNTNQTATPTASKSDTPTVQAEPKSGTSLAAVLPQYRQQVAESKYPMAFSKRGGILNDDGKPKKFIVDGVELTALGGNIFLIDEHFPVGLRTYNMILESDSSSEPTLARWYNMPYSVVAGGSVYGVESAFRIYGVPGLRTDTETLNRLMQDKAVFNYVGKAFNAKNEGTLTYTVDFGNKSGSGKVSGLPLTDSSASKDIELQPATFSSNVVGSGLTGLEGSADGRQKYFFVFNGPNAEEIGGAILDQGATNLIDRFITETSNGAIGLGACRTDHHCQ